MKILVHGNPIDGLRFIGPFPDDANIDSLTDHIDDDWWPAELAAPETTDTENLAHETPPKETP